MTKENRELLNYIYFRNIDTFILYRLDLPFDLNVNFDFHEILTNDLNVNFLQKTNRLIALKSEKRWQESINICGRDVVSVSIDGAIDGDVKYTNSIMSLKIIVPVFKDELGNCLSAFRDDNNRALLISNIMYLLRNKINEILVEDFNLDVSLYGAERALIFQLNETKNSFEIISGLMSQGYRLKKEKRLHQSSYTYINNDSICIWRYYANKCEISYNFYQNLDCVLFAAMAIESYINHLYIVNGLDNHDDNVFKSLKYLKENNLISLDDYKEIKSSFGKIHVFRNEIVHGKIQSIFQEREKAQEAYETIVAFFNNKISDDPNIKSTGFPLYKQRLSSTIKMMAEKKFEIAAKEFEWFLENNYYYSISNYYLGVCHLFMKELQKAKTYFNVCYSEHLFFSQTLYYLACIEKIDGNGELFIKFKKELLEYINKSVKNKTEMYMSIVQDLDEFENQNIINVKLFWI